MVPKDISRVLQLLIGGGGCYTLGDLRLDTSSKSASLSSL